MPSTTLPSTGPPSVSRDGDRDRYTVRTAVPATPPPGGGHSGADAASDGGVTSPLAALPRVGDSFLGADKTPLEVRQLYQAVFGLPVTQ